MPSVHLRGKQNIANWALVHGGVSDLGLILAIVLVRVLLCWGRRETAPFQPVLAGATGARTGMPIGEDAVRTL
jgi:hypothetical protein